MSVGTLLVSLLLSFRMILDVGTQQTFAELDVKPRRRVNSKMERATLLHRKQNRDLFDNLNSRVCTVCTVVCMLSETQALDIFTQ